MSLRERSKVDHELRRLGFGGLDDPNLNMQIAFCIRDHAHLRSQLFSVDAEQRRHAYHALAPHLRFAPKPLDVYESEMKEMAEKMRLPTFDGSAYPKEFSDTRISELAQEAIKQNAHEKDGGLELVCARCTFAQVFRAPLRKTAEQEGQRAGWRSDGVKNWCPKHVPTRLAMTLTCKECEIVKQIRAWDPQDGYAGARLRGWVIDEDATCPKCAVKKLVLQ